MPNLNTVNAITANLKAILEALGLKVEDLTYDPDADSTPLCQLDYTGERFGRNHGQGPLYNNIGFDLTILFRKSDPDTSRTEQATWIHKIRDAVTVDALNVDDLAASKLVSLVAHLDVDVEYRSPMTQITYELHVRYREL